MGNFRVNFNRVSRVLSAATLASALSVSVASAQASQGTWGVEGRIGSGQAAYVTAWFNENWSLLLGGGFTSTSSENQNNATNDVQTASLQAIFRREWGGSRVHPFFGFGPVLNLSHAVNKSPGGGAITETTSDNVGLGGRFEFGALGHVTQNVDLGLVLGVAGTHNEVTNKTSGSTIETKSSNNSVSLGNPQFIIRVRF